jgi:hypothetical protein
MANAPPAALLRLREADVVRLCGFAAAATGLELADRHAVTGGARDGSRLQATVASEPSCHVAVELPREGGAGGIRWSCTAHTSALSTELGCAHVAALLTAWIRAPSDFPADDAAPTAPTAANIAVPDSPPKPQINQPLQINQPPLIAASRAARPRGSGLQDELAALTATELLAIARRVLGADLSEHEARAALAQALADPERLAALLARLDAGPQQLFASLQLLGGAITATDLDALARRFARPASAIRTELAVLARHGLIFAAPGALPTAAAVDRVSAAHRSWRELSGWRIPPELRATVTPRLPLDPLPTREPQGIPVPAIGEVQMAGRLRAVRVQRASLRPLLLALALLARAPAPLGPFGSGRPGGAARSHVPMRAGDGDRRHTARDASPPSSGRLAALARAAGLDPGGAALARHILLLANESAPGQPLTNLARVPAAEHLAALRAGFRLWRDDEGDDAAETQIHGEPAGPSVPDAPIRLRLDTTHPAFRPGALGAELAQARRFVLQLLASASPGTWYALDDFVAMVWRLDPLFLRVRQQAHEMPAWWLEGVQEKDGVWRPLRPTEHAEWMAGEGVYLRQLLMGPLRAWGALDLAFDSIGAPFAFRLSEFGRLALTDREDAVQVEIPTPALLAGDWGPAVLPTRSGDLAVQPLAAGAEVLDALDRWARPAGLAGGRLIYALSRDLACAAFDRGAPPQELPQQLRVADPGRGERAATLVARRLATWRADYGQTCIREGWALLEAHDEPALVEALALVPGLSARCHRLGATSALIPPDDLAALRPLLARRGYPV